MSEAGGKEFVETFAWVTKYLIKEGWHKNYRNEKIMSCWRLEGVYNFCRGTPINVA